jgi:hypothetical protein
MSTYTQYTGTFTKKDGTTRTMSFIKTQDLPSSHFTSKQINGGVSSDNSEVVYDTNVRSFRRFNRSTQVGTLSERTIQYSFDNK